MDDKVKGKYFAASKHDYRHLSRMCLMQPLWEQKHVLFTRPTRAIQKKEFEISKGKR